MSGGRRLNPWDQSITEMPETPRHNATTPSHFPSFLQRWDSSGAAYISVVKYALPQLIFSGKRPLKYLIL